MHVRVKHVRVSVPPPGDPANANANAPTPPTGPAHAPAVSLPALNPEPKHQGSTEVADAEAKKTEDAMDMALQVPTTH